MSTIYLFDARDLDRVGADIALLKAAGNLREFFSVTEDKRNAIVRRVLDLDIKTVLVPSDRHRHTPTLNTISDVLKSLGFRVRTIGEHIHFRAPAAYPAIAPAAGTAVGARKYPNNPFLTTTR